MKHRIKFTYSQSLVLVLEPTPTSFWAKNYPSDHLHSWKKILCPCVTVWAKANINLNRIYTLIKRIQDINNSYKAVCIAIPTIDFQYAIQEGIV